MRKYIFQDGGEPEAPQQDDFFSGLLGMMEQGIAAQEGGEESYQEAAQPAEEDDEFITNLRAYDDEQTELSKKDEMELMFQGYMAKIDERLSHFEGMSQEQDLFPDDPDEVGRNYDTRTNATPYFSNASSGGGNTIDRIAGAIGKYESSGNPQARGPVIPSGRYKGERALGKYQIMPGNLPSWSMEAIGRQVTEQEFLSNPALQDQIAKHQMSKIYQKYGNEEDVASVWLTGKPRGNGNTAKDVNGIGSQQYVANVMKNY